MYIFRNLEYLSGCRSELGMATIGVWENSFDLVRPTTGNVLIVSQHPFCCDLVVEARNLEAKDANGIIIIIIIIITIVIIIII